MDPSLWIGPVIVAAAIAGLINVVGWFVTFRQARRLQKASREEKVVDIQTALLAEIRSDLQNLVNIRVRDEMAIIRQKLSAPPEHEPYTPFVPKDSGAPVFSAIVKDIAVLPTEVIDPVILYYKQRESIAHFTEDLREETFKTLTSDRKLTMMEDYLQLKAHAGLLAADAVSALEGSLGLPRSFNNMASGRSDQQSALAAASVQTSSVSTLPYKPE